MESDPANHSGFSSNQDICRICHCEGEVSLPLISPCCCCGSLQYVHQSCLQQWIKSSDTRQCELCKFPFIMRTKTKPLTKWRIMKLDHKERVKLTFSLILMLSGMFCIIWALYVLIVNLPEFRLSVQWEQLELGTLERRRLAFSVLLHVVGIGCVVWSLYVLVERAAQEVNEGDLKWPFWTKLFVVGVGFGGGLVVMYIQCKTYMQLCHRWKAFNRVIYVQNAPEKVPLCEQEMSDFQVISPSSSTKVRHQSLDNLSVQADGTPERLKLAPSVEGLNRGREGVMPLSRSVVDITAVHYGQHKNDIRKTRSVANNLPKSTNSILLSVFKTTASKTSALTRHRSEERLDAHLSPHPLPNPEVVLESCPLLSSLSDNIVGVSNKYLPSTVPSNYVIVHKSEDKSVVSTSSVSIAMEEPPSVPPLENTTERQTLLPDSSEEVRVTVA